jgi:hypothetical protein
MTVDKQRYRFMGIDKGVLQRRPIQPCEPFKHLRYPVPRPIRKPKPVTVCIAAACQENGEPRIVVCADTRLDSSYVGSTDGNLKIGKLAYGWLGLLSGADFMGARDIHDRIKTSLLAKGPPADREKLYDLLKRAGKSYLKSSLNSKLQIDLIIAGFIGGKQCIATLSVSDSADPTVFLAPAYKAVGSGGSIAEMFLNIRDCNPEDPLARVRYVVYEAKKYSEKASGVGPETKLTVIAPPPAGAKPEHVFLFNTTAEELTYFEEMRGLYGVQKITGTATGPHQPLRLSPATAPDPQPPTTDPSGPPPSQE